MATKVLVVDDEDAIGQMYQLKFEYEGYTVQTAKNGKEGLKQAEKMKPNVILLDLMMPEMSGTEMLTQLRATEWGKNMNVVILTNVSDPALIEIANTLGAKKYLIKAHYSPTQVVEIVKEFAAP